MCNKYGKIVLLSAVIAVFGLVANVQAEVIYDFDRGGITTGPLSDQDGWYKFNGTTEGFNVATGAEGWSGNYAAASANGYARRDNGGGWSYSLTNGVDFNVYADFLVKRTGSVIGLAGIAGDAADPQTTLGINAILMAVDRYNGSAPKDYLWWAIYLDSGGSAPWLGPVRLNITNTFPDIEGDFILTMGWEVTATAPGSYSARPYYLDPDDSSQVYASSPYTFTTVQLGGDISTAFDGLMMRSGSTSGVLIDNITVDQVPEPSTLALLGCGLLGLLAYAWRKRK